MYFEPNGSAGMQVPAGGLLTRRAQKYADDPDVTTAKTSPRSPAASYVESKRQFRIIVHRGGDRGQADEAVVFDVVEVTVPAECHSPYRASPCFQMVTHIVPVYRKDVPIGRGGFGPFADDLGNWAPPSARWIFVGQLLPFLSRAQLTLLLSVFAAEGFKWVPPTVRRALEGFAGKLRGVVFNVERVDMAGGTCVKVQVDAEDAAVLVATAKHFKAFARSDALYFAWGPFAVAALCDKTVPREPNAPNKPMPMEDEGNGRHV